MAETGFLSALPMQRLLAAYATARQRPLFAILFAFDARLADVIRKTSEPMLGRIRLQWWHDVLTGTAANQGRGEALAMALTDVLVPKVGGKPLARLVEGWEVLTDAYIDEAMLLDYAHKRGMGLFEAGTALGESTPEHTELIGTIWALVDLAAHSSDPALAERAMALAQARQAQVAGVPRTWPKPLRILGRLALADAKVGQIPSARLDFGRYLHIVRLGLF